MASTSVFGGRRASATANEILSTTGLDDVVVIGNLTESELVAQLQKYEHKCNYKIDAAIMKELLQHWNYAVAECDDEIANDSKGYVSTLRVPPPPEPVACPLPAPSLLLSYVNP